MREANGWRRESQQDVLPFAPPARPARGGGHRPAGAVARSPGPSARYSSSPSSKGPGGGLQGGGGRQGEAHSSRPEAAAAPGPRAAPSNTAERLARAVRSPTESGGALLQGARPGAPVSRPGRAGTPTEGLVYTVVRHQAQQPCRWASRRGWLCRGSVLGSRAVCCSASSVRMGLASAVQRRSGALMLPSRAGNPSLHAMGPTLSPRASQPSDGRAGR